MNWVRVTCGWCGKAFSTRQCDVDRGHGKFCSLSCSSRYTNSKRPVGNSRSRTRERAREAWVSYYGSEPLCEVCGKKADVHHENEDPTDNRKENLRAWCRSHHVAYHHSKDPKRKKNLKKGVEKCTQGVVDFPPGKEVNRTWADQFCSLS